jgi:hypothetical protein
MQMSKLLSACMIALLLVGWGITPGALADEEAVDQNKEETTAPEADSEVVFAQALGAGQAADVFRLTCGAGCACARATLNDPAGGPAANVFGATLVGNLFVGAAGSSFTGFTPVGGGNSGTAQVCQGSGQYLVAVYKNTVLAEAYNANLSCVFPSGALCAHAVVFLQNQ